MTRVLKIIALGAAFLAMPAFAVPYGYGYVGAGVGQAKTDSDHTSYKLFGGVQSTQYFGAELAYNDFRDYRGEKADSWSLAATGKLPLDRSWDILGKLGATRNRIKFGGSHHRTELLAGVGIGYNLSPNVGLRLEYEDFGKLPTDINGNQSSVNNWGLNVKFSF